jgi:3',5'-cyclic AMP phosphodiesterase CpdA
VVISDLNGAYGSTDYDPEVDRAIALLPLWNPDLVLCSGDMVAGQRTSLTRAQIQAMWTAFDRHVAAPLRAAAMPFGFTLGNHDGSGSRNASGGFTFQQERDLAAAYWTDPRHDPGVDFVDRQQFPFYYSFRQTTDQGDVFFLVWDGSTSRIPPEQLAWVEATLASPAAQQAQLRVLMGHLPLYGIAEGRDRPGEVMNNADALRQLLERYNVHTYISGHHHAYYPGHRGQLQLLHTGALGGGPRSLISGNSPRTKTLTVVDVDFQHPDLTTYTTYAMNTLRPVATGTLPRLLTGHNGLVLRRDVETSDLTTAEINQCRQRLGANRCP